jgi:hypothetical protein
MSKTLKAPIRTRVLKRAYDQGSLLLAEKRSYPGFTGIILKKSGISLFLTESSVPRFSMYTVKL